MIKGGAVLYDFDGKGLTPSLRLSDENGMRAVDESIQRAGARESKRLDGNNIPDLFLPMAIDVDNFSIGYDFPNGERLGPYTYRADFRAAFENLINIHNDKPSLTCVGRTCQSTNYLSWLGTTKVSYGPTLDDLSNVMETTLTVNDVMEKACWRVAERSGMQNCYPVSFDYPNTWDDLYYSIVYQDGTNSPTIRHVSR